LRFAGGVILIRLQMPMIFSGSIVASQFPRISRPALSAIEPGAPPPLAAVSTRSTALAGHSRKPARLDGAISIDSGAAGLATSGLTV
jgi:hypothetical protein